MIRGHVCAPRHQENFIVKSVNNITSIDRIVNNDESPY